MDLNKHLFGGIRDFKLFGCKNFTSRLTERMITHTVDTSGGQSGSPILRWNKNKEIYQVIGIHTKAIILLNENEGVRLTRKVLIRIK
jgi:V8-like Glu-specific endopeptidase